MKRPKIIEGLPFDWYAGQRAAANSVYPDGEVNWKAAFYADPGVLSCPFCDAHMWREGIKVECPECEQEFNVNWRDVVRKKTGKDPVYKRFTDKGNANIVGILHEANESASRLASYTVNSSAPPIIIDFIGYAKAGLINKK